MDTATASVVVSGVVALASLSATVWQHRRGLQHQRKLADLENVRSVLDDAAAELHAVQLVLSDVRSQVGAQGASWWRNDEGTKAWMELGELAKRLEALTARLSVRFGRSHSVVEALGSAEMAVWVVYQTGGLVRHGPFDHDPAKGEAWERDMRDATLTRCDRFRPLWNTFIDEAQRVAGAELPSKGSRSRVRLVREKSPSD